MKMPQSNDKSESATFSPPGTTSTFHNPVMPDAHDATFEQPMQHAVTGMGEFPDGESVTIAVKNALEQAGPAAMFIIDSGFLIEGVTNHSTPPHSVPYIAGGALAAHPDVFRSNGQYVQVREGQLAPMNKIDIRTLLRQKALLKIIVRSKQQNGGISQNLKVIDNDLAETVASLPVPVCVRELDGVTRLPILRMDGSLHTVKGYDCVSKLYLTESPAVETIELAMRPFNDVSFTSSVAALCQPVRAYPFAAPEGVGVWMSHVFSIAAHHLINGPIPLTVYTSPTQGSGKSNLMCAAAMITKQRMNMQSGELLIGSAATVEENRKALLALAIAGEINVLYDNPRDGTEISDPSISSAITSGSIAGRMLGQTRHVRAKFRPVFAVAGNNLSVDADFSRRTTWCRLDPQTERPELRRFDFDFVAEVEREADRLLGHILYILRCYLAHGCPGANELPKCGFDAWSRIVRGCIIQMNLRDPYAPTTRERVERPDSTSEKLRAAMAWIEAVLVLPRAMRSQRGVTARQLITEARNIGGNGLISMHAESLGLTSSTTANWLGRTLWQLVGRVIDGRRIVVTSYQGTAHYRVEGVQAR
jgi:hypothetical protein